MIVLLNNEDEAMLRTMCSCDVAHKGFGGVVLVKEGPDGEVLFWTLRSSHRFEPFDQDSRPIPYVNFRRAQTVRESKGGQFALWLRSDFDWTTVPLISDILEQNANVVIMPDGQKVSVTEMIQIRKKLDLLDDDAQRMLLALCRRELDLRSARQLREQYLLDDDDTVPPIVAAIALDTLVTRLMVRKRSNGAIG